MAAAVPGVRYRAVKVPGSADAAQNLTADVCPDTDGGDLARYTDTLMRFTVSFLHAARTGPPAVVIHHSLPRQINRGR